MTRPNIIWKGSPNYGYPQGMGGRNGYSPIAIVYHITAGTASSADSWFKNPASGASSHFLITKKGEIWQYVEEDNAAWTVGDVTKPSWALLIPGVNPNLYTYNLEFEGWHEDGKFYEPTEEQYQAGLAVVRYLVERDNIPVDMLHHIGHNQINTVNRPFDPGPGFPFKRLFADLKPQLKRTVTHNGRVVECAPSEVDGKTRVDLRPVIESLKGRVVTGITYDGATNTVEVQSRPESVWRKYLPF